MIRITFTSVLSRPNLILVSFRVPKMNSFFFLTEVSFQLSTCSDRGSFANPHLGEFLTPWISPLDMIFVGWQRFSSCYVVISRLEKPGNNNMRWPGFEPRSVAWPSALETITPRGHPRKGNLHYLYSNCICKCRFKLCDWRRWHRILKWLGIKLQDNGSKITDDITDLVAPPAHWWWTIKQV